MIKIILHNIRSAYNIGSFFRICDGVNIKKIYIGGFSPTPKSDLKKIIKTSLGSENNVDWEKYDDIDKLIKKYKNKKYDIISIENTKKAIDYRNFDYNKKDILFVFGNEITGIDKKILDISNFIIKIPMRGLKESLNVSVCGGIILYKATEKL